MKEYPFLQALQLWVLILMSFVLLIPCDCLPVCTARRFPFTICSVFSAYIPLLRFPSLHDTSLVYIAYCLILPSQMVFIIGLRMASISSCYIFIHCWYDLMYRIRREYAEQCFSFPSPGRWFYTIHDTSFSFINLILAMGVLPYFLIGWFPAIGLFRIRRTIRIIPIKYVEPTRSHSEAGSRSSSSLHQHRDKSNPLS